jgi:hypothetical protein
MQIPSSPLLPKEVRDGCLQGVQSLPLMLPAVNIAAERKSGRSDHCVLFRYEPRLRFPHSELDRLNPARCRARSLSPRRPQQRKSPRCGSLKQAALNELVAQLAEQRPLKEIRASKFTT